MTGILIAYAGSVLCNRAMNWLDWWARNRGKGPWAYFSEHGPLIAKTMILHVPLFALWWLGILLPVVNGALAGLAAVTGGAVSLPPLTSVEVMPSLAAGWVLDSIGSRISRYIKNPAPPAATNGG